MSPGLCALNIPFGIAGDSVSLKNEAQLPWTTLGEAERHEGRSSLGAQKPSTVGQADLKPEKRPRRLQKACKMQYPTQRGFGFCRSVGLC